MRNNSTVSWNLWWFSHLYNLPVVVCSSFSLVMQRQPGSCPKDHNLATFWYEFTSSPRIDVKLLRIDVGCQITKGGYPCGILCIDSFDNFPFLYRVIMSVLIMDAMWCSRRMLCHCVVVGTREQDSNIRRRVLRENRIPNSAHNHIVWLEASDDRVGWSFLHLVYYNCI
jgi:hypothetical protein